ncbi:MAG: ABC transporter permease [Chthoniobacterales bacterium]
MNDLRFAFRQLLKHPGFTATAVLALALGIGATTAIFGVVYAFLLRPLPYAEPERLVMLQSRSTQSGSDLGVNYLDFVDWKQEARSFSDLAFFNLRWNGNLQASAGNTETLKTTFTTANLFHVLGVAPVLGRDLLPADDVPDAPKVLLISHRLWQRTFGGDRSIIGRAIQLDGTPHTVVDVMPADFRFPSQTDLWVPMASVFGRSTDRSWRADQAIGRLRPGATIPQAQAEMTVIAERLAREHPETNKEVGATVVGLREHAVGGVSLSLVFLLAACGGVLLIACANVSQLLLARAVMRQREFSVRTALGATRLQLVRQLLSESALLAGLGSVVGILVAQWLVEFVTRAIPVELPFWLTIDVNPRVLAFTIIVSSAAALLAGSLPAWQATRIDVSEALKFSAAGNTGGSGRGGRTRDLLMMAQVAVSVILLVGASLVLRSVAKLDEVKPGFEARNVLMMEVNPTYNSDEPVQARVDRFSRLLHRISEMPGVEAVGANNSPPFLPQRPWNRAEFTAEYQSADEQSRNPRANFQTVSTDYFRTVRIRLQHGRVFDERDKLDAPRVCLISESLKKRLWPAEDAVGQRLKLGKPESGWSSASPDPEWMTIVGVVADVRHQSLEGEAGPDLYKPSLQLAWKQMHFLVRARDGVKASSFVPALLREVASIAPDVGVFNFTSLEKEVSDSVWQARLRGWLLGFFSVVALTLAAAGLYGTMAHGVTQRTREIGIRMALGATRAGVLRLVVGQGMRAVLLGLALGLVGALIMARILRASLFGIEASDPVSYAAAAVLLALTAGVACFLPARRAARVNPMEALRHE